MKEKTWISSNACSLHCLKVLETYKFWNNFSWGDLLLIPDVYYLHDDDISVVPDVHCLVRGEWLSFCSLRPHSTPDSRVTPQTRSWINLNKTNQRQATTLNKYEKLELKKMRYKKREFMKGIIVVSFIIYV